MCSVIFISSFISKDSPRASSASNIFKLLIVEFNRFILSRFTSNKLF